MSSPIINATSPLSTADAHEEMFNIGLSCSSSPASVSSSDDSNNAADSIISDAKTTADATEDMVKIELASSSRPPSAVGSDDSNTAADSVISAGETNDAVVVPYAGPFGSAYTQDTSPTAFSDWPTYLSFCENGPFLRLECVDSVNNKGMPTHLNQMKISKKLLCDHSEYFRAIFRHSFMESQTGRVQFVDILQEELMRLKLILMSGNPNSRTNIGNPEEEMTNLVRMYELADRFDMPKISRWIMDRTTEFVISHRNWRETYQQEVLNGPGASTITTAKEDFHRAKLLDFCTTYTKLAGMPERARLISPDQLATLIAECCHPLLLRSMMDHIDQEVYYAITEIILTKI
ncbi:hypothetical protein N0V93_007266 [Gnomoniopsis smithogilvyi]|uniref:BTB domain-containing protein n=1 Tax=Gnomoniopsis smithogilvyi TaxID=1191159 RepID=A0A9W9CVI6_9PEZI|nr:hypothetical protein N0V93_007266 [Gnomoniopsis smithogilvyi]